MRKKNSSFFLFAGLVCLLIGAYLFYSNFSGEQTLPEPPEPDLTEPELTETEPHTQAPDFRAETRDGAPVRLTDFLARPTIVYFWTSWCSWCTQGMDELESFYAEAEDVQVLTVNLSHLGRGDELEQARAFLETHDLPFPTLFDIYGEAQDAYAVTGVPMVLFIDSRGELIHTQLGFLDADGFAHFAEMLR